MISARSYSSAEAHSSANRYHREESSDDAETQELTEKNAIELELERRVFGDEAGFYEALSLHKEAGSIGDLALTGTSGNDDQDVDESEGDLQGVNDADVGQFTL